MPAWKFLLYNFIGAAIWAPLVAGVGYFFGSMLEAMLDDLRHVEMWGVAILLAIGVTGVIIHRMRDNKLDNG